MKQALSAFDNRNLAPVRSEKEVMHYCATDERGEELIDKRIKRLNKFHPDLKNFTVVYDGKTERDYSPYFDDLKRDMLAKEKR